MKLVIAEKPSVGTNIASVLGANIKKQGYLVGNGYIVSWCVGHLIELAEPEAYGEDYKIKPWITDCLPIIPEKWKFGVIKETSYSVQKPEISYEMIHVLMKLSVPPTQDVKESVFSDMCTSFADARSLSRDFGFPPLKKMIL